MKSARSRKWNSGAPTRSSTRTISSGPTRTVMRSASTSSLVSFTIGLLQTLLRYDEFEDDRFLLLPASRILGHRDLRDRVRAASAERPAPASGAAPWTRLGSEKYLFGARPAATPPSRIVTVTPSSIGSRAGSRCRIPSG